MTEQIAHKVFRFIMGRDVRSEGIGPSRPFAFWVEKPRLLDGWKPRMDANSGEGEINHR